MRHNIQDAYDARSRRDLQPTWHPMLATEERSVGVWTLVAQYGREYGTVSIVRRGGEVGYRADDENGELIDYYRTLRAACMAVHQRDSGRGVPKGWPNNDGARPL